MRTLLLLAVVAAGTIAQFTTAGQNGVIDAHNALRSKLAKGTYVAKGTQKPPASNMLKMKWDANIAASAQAYANGCPKVHSGAPGVGENIFWWWAYGSLGDLTQYGKKASDTWEKEFQDYGWTTNRMTPALFGSGIGHASAMAWANTKYVGCGIKDCGRDTSGPYAGLFKVTVVCQYKEPGNYMDQDIYATGAACSACPSGTSCEQSTGLCV